MRADLGRQQDQDMKVWAEEFPQAHYPKPFTDHSAWRNHSALSQPSPSMVTSPRLLSLPDTMSFSSPNPTAPGINLPFLRQTHVSEFYLLLHVVGKLDCGIAK